MSLSDTATRKIKERLPDGNAELKPLADFSEKLIDLERLPGLRWSTEIAGEVTHRAAAETGLAVGTPVTTGTIDAAAEAVSVGVREPGDMMLMYGSTMFMILVAASRVRDPGAVEDLVQESFLAAFARGLPLGEEGRWLVGIARHNRATLLEDIAHRPRDTSVAPGGAGDGAVSRDFNTAFARICEG